MGYVVISLYDLLPLKRITCIATPTNIRSLIKSNKIGLSAIHLYVYTIVFVFTLHQQEQLLNTYKARVRYIWVWKCTTDTIQNVLYKATFRAKFVQLYFPALQIKRKENYEENLYLSLRYTALTCNTVALANIIVSFHTYLPLSI